MEFVVLQPSQNYRSGPEKTIYILNQQEDLILQGLCPR